jgi:hypothetical protein
LNVCANYWPVLSTMTRGAPCLVVDAADEPEDEFELLQAATPIARMVAAARAFTVL